MRLRNFALIASLTAMLFVAAAPSSASVFDVRVSSSTAGESWTSRTTPADNGWGSVTYGNGLFVAVSNTGSGNRVMTSRNGINWTIRTTPVDNSWSSVTYGNGLFVAVSYTGTGNRVMTSPDGITWTSRASAADNFWLSVTFGNGLFVAVSNSGTGNRVMTSGALIPNAPAAPGAVAGDASATVTVTAASGGWPAASHTVTASPGGASCTIAGASGSCVVSGLANGTAYTFTATASNAVGTSAASASSASVTPTATPAPSNVFTVTKAKARITGASIVLTTRVKVPGAGRIVQTATTKKGAKVTRRCRAAKTAAGAATYTLKCKIGKAGRTALRKAKMTLTVTTTFTPTGGVLASKKQTVKLLRRR